MNVADEADNIRGGRCCLSPRKKDFPLRESQKHGLEVKRRFTDVSHVGKWTAGIGKWELKV